MEQILFFVLMIGVLILVHEWGHYLLARAMGVHVIEFAIGVGPKIMKLKGKQRKVGDQELPRTEFTIGALPFGGFVRMLGTDPHEVVPPEIEAVSFNARPVWRRFLIMIAGPAFNILLALVIYFAAGLGTSTLPSSLMGSVDYSGPASQAGLRPGDRIVAIDGEEISYFWEIVKTIEAKVQEGDKNATTGEPTFTGVPFELTWERHGERTTRTVKPIVFMKEDVTGVPALGTSPVGRIGVKQVNIMPLIAVLPGSPAEAAGLRNWDRIVAVDGVAVDLLPLTMDALYRASGKPVKVAALGYEDASANGVALAVAAARVVELPAAAKAAEGDTAPPATDGSRGIYSAECLVHGVVPGSPAAKAGVMKGDRLMSFEGVECLGWDFFEQRIVVAGAKGGALVLQRGQDTIKTTLAMGEIAWPDELRKEATMPVHGIEVLFRDAPIEYIENTDRVTYAFHYMGEGITGAVTSVVSTLGALFSGRAKLKDSVMGPGGMAQLAAMSVERGWAWFFALMAGFSVSLGIMNLLPIPILDGGQILFLAIEGVRRKPVSMRVRMIATYAGLAFVILLMIIVTRNDIERCLG